MNIFSYLDYCFEFKCNFYEFIPVFVDFCSFFQYFASKITFRLRIFLRTFFSVIKYIAHFLKMSITFVKEFVLPLTPFSLDYLPILQNAFHN